VVSIDRVNPTVVSVVASDSLISEADTGASQTFSIALTFSEVMSTAHAPQLTFGENVAATLQNPQGIWSEGNTIYTVTYGVADANVDLRNITVAVSGARDAVGNEQVTHTAVPRFSVDTVKPTVAVDIVGTSLSDTVSTSQVTFTFSEAPTDFTNSDVTLAGGTLSAVTPVAADTTNRTYSATFTATDGFAGTGSSTG